MWKWLQSPHCTFVTRWGFELDKYSAKDVKQKIFPLRFPSPPLSFSFISHYPSFIPLLLSLVSLFCLGFTAIMLGYPGQIGYILPLGWEHHWHRQTLWSPGNSHNSLRTGACQVSHVCLILLSPLLCCLTILTTSP